MTEILKFLVRLKQIFYNILPHLVGIIVIVGEEKSFINEIYYYYTLRFIYEDRCNKRDCTYKKKETSATVG